MAAFWLVLAHNYDARTHRRRGNQDQTHNHLMWERFCMCRCVAVSFFIVLLGFCLHSVRAPLAMSLPRVVDTTTLVAAVVHSHAQSTLHLVGMCDGCPLVPAAAATANMDSKVCPFWKFLGLDLGNPRFPLASPSQKTVKHFGPTVSSSDPVEPLGVKSGSKVNRLNPFLMLWTLLCEFHCHVSHSLE